MQLTQSKNYTTTPKKNSYITKELNQFSAFVRFWTWFNGYAIINADTSITLVAVNMGG